MCRRTNQAFRLFCLLLLASYLFTGNGTAAIGPDPQIKAELISLFEETPEVKGYPFQEFMEKAAVRYGLPLPYLLAVARGESFFDPSAESTKGALGILQVLPTTAADYGVKADELFDPATNIDVGARHLAELYSKLQDPYLALAAYYCGYSGVDKNGSALRQECDEYVHYIHAHLQKILSDGKQGGPPFIQNANFFELAVFDNFLDAQGFKAVLFKNLPDRQFDILRKEVAYLNHTRYAYQILIAYNKDEERKKICQTVEKTTGFSFCR
jgi:hypothetical protein